MPKSPAHKLIREVLAANLKYARQLAALSQESLAEVSGLHRTQVGALERGASGASVDTLARLATALGIQVHLLLMKEAEAQPAIWRHMRESAVVRKTQSQ